MVQCPKPTSQFVPLVLCVLSPFLPRANSALMPGPHLDLKIMQCYRDVGGVDAWLGGFWSDHPYPNQWSTGWHQAGVVGVDALSNWSWPSQGPNTAWRLIGYEQWQFCRRGDRLRQAYYVHPNPSTSRDAGPPEGFWHVYVTEWGHHVWTWSWGHLTDEHSYLKGGVTGPKGAGNGILPKGAGKGKGKDQGKGKGKDQKGKGKEQKGKGKNEKGKGKGKNKGEGKGKGKDEGN